jgi:phosphate transport system permease protein
MRAAITNLAGVPSIVFGLFGLGFFVGFLGGGIDGLAGSGGIKWGRPALVWASLTLALMTLPVVIVATEESLRAIPSGIREAALALGATRLQTIVRVVLPQAVPGILTGGILAIGRAAGEVAPILFTGAAFLTDGRIGLADRFMDLAYHVFVLSTQSPDLERSRPLLHASVLVLLVLTVLLNLLAVLVRARIRAAAPARS